MAQRVLFIRLSALGDVVMTLPALTALRRARPDVRVDWVVEDRFSDLLACVSGIDRIITFPRRELRKWSAPASLVRHLSAVRSVQYDAAIDFQGNLKGALHLAACRAWRKIGLDAEASREGAHLAATTRVPVRADTHRAERALGLLAPLGIAVPRLESGGIDPVLRPEFKVDPAVDEQIEQLLIKVRRGAYPLVLLHPGTSAFGAFKRYPPDGFSTVARLLRKQFGADVLITQGPGEEDLAHQVEKGAEGAAAVCPPAPGLRGLVALLRRADLVLAADSGPLQIAAAVGVPTVGIFGPKDPGIYAPPYAGNRTIHNNVPCSPCSLRQCEDPVCVTGLTPEAIIHEVRAILDRSTEGES